MSAKTGNLKTRPDLADDREWLAWLRLQPENRGIEVADLYRRMIEWCRQKGVNPTRRRLLNWLNNERDSVPMTYEPDNSMNSINSKNCPTCSGTRRVRVNDHNAPCPKCRPAEEKAFWRSRGR